MDSKVQGEDGPDGATARARAAAPKQNDVATRRTFTAEYKLRVLHEADACRGKPGAIGALLKREGLRSSHLVLWRKTREKPGGIADRKRGPAAKAKTTSSRRIAAIERQVAELIAKLKQLRSSLEA